jgi:hypothetical protein
LAVIATEHVLKYFITLVITFLGLYAGAALAFIAPEELKSGKNYFKAILSGIIVITVTYTLYYFNAPISILIVLGIFLAALLYFLRTAPVGPIAYYLSGFMFFFSSLQEGLLLPISSLIFLFGIPAGTLYAYRHLERGWRVVFGDILLNYGLFLVVAMLANLFAVFIVASA